MLSTAIVAPVRATALRSTALPLYDRTSDEITLDEVERIAI
jgi:hypothetical protein